MLEMKCYCEKEHKKNLFVVPSFGEDTSCDNTINYIHDRDWSGVQDYVCEECLKTCHADL